MSTPTIPGNQTAIYSSNAWNGIYYENDNPTITITNNAFYTQSASFAPVGCTTWWILNDEGVQVASGTSLLSDMSITVATNGVWSSGGNVEIGAYQFYSNSSPTAVFGGGVTTWNQAVSPDGQTGWDASIWWGVVTQSGTSLLYTSAERVEGPSCYVAEFQSSNGPSTTWSQIAEGYSSNSVASTSISYPSLVSTAAGQLYVGGATANFSLTAGTTSGFTWVLNNANNAIYNTNCAAGTISPSATATTSSYQTTVGVILSDGGGTISYVNDWLGPTVAGDGGTANYITSISPANVGDILVFIHGITNTQVAFNAPNGPWPSPISQGCLFCVCPPTRMFNPVASGYTQSTSGTGIPNQTDNSAYLCAWMGVAQARDAYSDSNAATQVAALYATDPCFNGTWLDSARPRIPWMAPSEQGVSVAPWSTTVPAMVSAGLTGWAYELPSNEPENGPSPSPSQIVTDYNTARSEVLAADPTAKCMAFCSGGIPEDTDFTTASYIFSNLTGYDYVSAHDENSFMIQPILPLLKEKWQGIKNLFTNSTNPNVIAWSTETGMQSSYNHVYHPRRHAQEVLHFLLVRESVGYRKEFAYFFKTVVASGTTTQPTGFLEASTISGSIRMGGYAAHILSEALYGTLCSPSSPPISLDFGPPGSVGDSLFMGLHYTSPSLARDVIVLITSGLGGSIGETVTLNLSSMIGVSVWNGVGRDITSQCTISGNEITVPVDDLATYVFAPENVSVSLVDTSSHVLSILNQQTNILPFTSQLQWANTTTFPVSELNWENYYAYTPGSVGTGYPVNYLPVGDTIPLPTTIVSETFPYPITICGFVYQSPFPWWPTQWATTALSLDFEGLVSGTWTTLYSYTNPTASSNTATTSPNPDITLRTTYWDHTFSWVATFSSVEVTAVRMVINSLSQAGEVDTASIDVALTFAAFPPSLQVTQFQVFWDRSMEATPPGISTAMKLSGA